MENAGSFIFGQLSSLVHSNYIKITEVEVQAASSVLVGSQAELASKKDLLFEKSSAVEGAWEGYSSQFFLDLLSDANAVFDSLSSSLTDLNAELLGAKEKLQVQDSLLAGKETMISSSTGTGVTK